MPHLWPGGYKPGVQMASAALQSELSLALLNYEP